MVPHQPLFLELWNPGIAVKSHETTLSLSEVSGAQRGLELIN